MANLSTEDARAAAARIGAVAEIVAISLRQLEWTMPEVPVAPGLPIALATEFSIEGGLALPHFAYRVGATVVGSIPESQEIFRLRVTYQLIFSVPEVEARPDDDLRAFGQISVMFMAFPYLREIVQDVCGRAGFGNVILAPLRQSIDQPGEETKNDVDPET